MGTIQTLCSFGMDVLVIGSLRRRHQLMGKLPIQVSALGVLPGEEIVRYMTFCDFLLFARGGICSRRGSAIAGIARGLPLVALEGPETVSPFTEAGVVFADPKSQRDLGEALAGCFSMRTSALRLPNAVAARAKAFFLEGDYGALSRSVVF